MIISFLMVFVYAIFVVNAYVSIKYEVETIDNDAIINVVYHIFNTGVAVNGVFLSIVIKCIQREVDGMKKRKSEITVSEVVRRLVDRKIS